MNQIDVSLIDWSRAQFALTAMYHWLFVPLTLGLGVIMALMETIYYRTGDLKWKRTTKFWMKLFGINFAVGVATGIILEFEFGANWSNYSWFVGDIFGAPLAIEGIFAFFIEATFIAVMFFGWNKVSKGFHLASTWLVLFGATLSALWILVANAWMQYPVGMEFNPDIVRNEMNDFWALVFSPVAINKFFHTVLSGWMLGAAFVVGVSAWFLLKKRDTAFAIDSIKVATLVGIIGILLSIWTGDGSAYQVAQKQPMKFAAMEGLYEGGNGIGLVGVGVLTPGKEYGDDKEPFVFRMEFPKMLSFLSTRDLNGYVPGINNLIEGGYDTPEGKAVSMKEKMEKGKIAQSALQHYREAKKDGNETLAADAKKTLDENFKYFGYGYFDSPKDAIPDIPLVFYSFRIMVILAAFFLLLFVLVWFFTYKKKLESMKWLQWICLLSIPLAYIASQAGWIVAEVGRQPWAIQDILPVQAAISDIDTGSVKLTFFIFLVLFTVLLIAEIGILVKQIRKGPETIDN
ncbi:cytochrome d ubiquinol oxidase subunit I [Bacteroidia bacterium]|nr:cytochrome d ubiquinol oxidase subunit I [Bacteroidia bacterium]GHV20665.1 cytochrome d ubiquinol oxidase subunit I [Bacteroidia bacterium]